MNSLLKSRKFWLAVFGVVQALVLGTIPDFPDEIWQSIVALVVTMISAIAVEDHGLKMGGGQNGGGHVE